MAEEKKQVTIRFESTMDSANSEPLLLSGPIQIFGSVDTFAELSSKRTNINDPNHPTLMDAIFEADELPQIVMFVNDVGVLGNGEIIDINEDSQPHRGAYFLFTGDRKGLSCTAGLDWQEILLGTHTHENKDQLDNLADLSNIETDSLGNSIYKDDRLVAIDPNGQFKLIENKEGRYLPELPIEIQNKIKELELYKDLNEPEESEWHHLDADLDLLNDTYDWMHQDENGNYINIEAGNCRDLYRTLVKADRKLFIDSDYKLSTESGLSYLALEIYNVNFDPSQKLEFYENVLIDNTNPNRLLLTLKFPSVIEPTDDIFVFRNKTLLTNSDFEVVLKDTHSITFAFNKYRTIASQDIVHVLVSRGNADHFGIINAFETGRITIDEINTSLTELFVKGEFSRKPTLPHLYLTTDENGNVHWDNKLLPPQYFYASKQYVKKSDADENGILKVTFKDVFYNTSNRDFIILMADEVFAFDIQPSEAARDVVYLIDINEYDRYFAEEVSTQLTLIVIKNSVNNSIADVIASKYISKEEGIKLMTHGNIMLDDYAKKSDLKAFSLATHGHTDYAKKNHNHDNKYANYSHSHPELAGIIAKISKASPEQVEGWINSLTYDLRDRVDAILKEKFQIDLEGDVDITVSNKAENIIVDKDIIDLINYKIESEGYPLEPLNMNEEGTYYLNRVLEYLTRFFELDMVPSHKVFLGFDIPVTNQVGGIKREKYFANDFVGDILRDMLNPYTNASEAAVILTPVKEYSFLKWYIKDENDKYIELDTENIKQKENGQIFFKPFFRNNLNDVCEFKYTSKLTGETTLSTTEIIEDYTKDAAGYYLYDTDFNFKENETQYPEINISWENITVYDSYGGSTTKLNPEGLSFNLQPTFNIILPTYYTGTLEDVNILQLSTFNNFVSHVGNKDNIKFNLMENKIIGILMDSSIENFRIIEKSTGMDIRKTFSERDNSITIFNKSYTLYYYEVLNQNIDLVSVKIEVKEG